MASIIRIKRSGSTGNPGTLAAGELAYSAADSASVSGGDRLYIGFGTETAGNAANHLVIGGKYFTDKLDHALGTLTANSAILVDADSKIDNLKVDNLDFNGNTISSTNTDGNIVIDPAGNGYIHLVGTNGVVLPVGTTLQRGPSVQGTIRYNTDTSSFEGYSGATWGSLGGVKSVDGLTYITAESSPGASNDTLSFVTDGTERFFIDTDTAEFDSTVDVKIDSTTASTDSTTGALVVAGGAGVGGDMFVGGDLAVAGSMDFTGGATFGASVTITGSDTAATEIFTIENESGVDKFTVDTANGNTSIAGTLGVTGESTLASATISDLTSGRVTYAGASGSLIDSANLTFNGTTLTANALSVTNNATVGGTLGVTGAATLSSTLGVTGAATLSSTLGVTGAVTLSSTLDVTGAVGIDGNFDVATNKFTVNATTGDTTIAGSLTVNGIDVTGGFDVSGGEATFASATVSDLTSGRIVLAGTAGSLEDSGNLTFNGSTLAVTGNETISGTLGVTGATTITGQLNVNGGISADSGAFTVTDTTGDVYTAGDLDVDGSVTLGDTLDVAGLASLDGGIDVDGAFTVADTTGNVSTTGTLTVSGATALNGGLTMDTDKFTVADSTGNVATKGTLDVDGATNLNGTLTVDGDILFGANSGLAAVNITSYGKNVNYWATTGMNIAVAGASATPLSLGITATNVTGSANLDLNADNAITVDGQTISLDATDVSNFTVTANSASTKTLTIDATNSGTGSAQINIGSSSTDDVVIAATNQTTIGYAGSVVQLNGAGIDLNSSGATSIDAGNTIDLTSTSGVNVNSDVVNFYGTSGAGNDAAVAITGSLDVDNIKLAGNTISTTDGSNTLTIDPSPSGSGGTVIIEGNLTVNGTQTTINSTTVTIDDPIFVLGGDTAPESDDGLERGVEYQYYDGGSSSAKIGFFGWNNTNNEFVFIPDATDSSGSITGTLGAAAFNTLRLTGTTASTGTTSGALVVAGGVGVGGQLNVGGATNKFTATTASSSTTTGAVVVAGGVGVAGNVYTGGNLVGAGAATSALDGFDIDGGTY